MISEIEVRPQNSDLYYADESGLDEHYAREYGYALRGEKVVGKVSGKHFARTSLMAAKNGREIVAPFAFSGSMDGGLFEGWLEYVFVQALKKTAKKVLILDNPSFHRKSAIYDIADEYGFRALFLTPYLSDLNSIENFWARLKEGYVYICTSSLLWGRQCATFFIGLDYSLGIR